MTSRSALVEWTWKPEEVTRFWRFVAERHEMFIRRVLDRQPPPWTDDPVLAGVAFTNVYRELDRGTRYLIRHILGRPDPPADIWLNVLVYRFFNHIPTYEFLGGFWPPSTWDLDTVAHKLVERHRAGHRLYTNAYMIQAVGAPAYLGGKAELVAQRIDFAFQNRVRLTRQLLGAASMREAHAVLTQIPGVAAFNAYELVIDLCYPRPAGRVLPFGEDDWVNVGPGAYRGLQAMTRGLQPKVAPQALHALWAGQEQGLETAQVIRRGPRQTLRNVEHSLCEFFKYVRASLPGQRAKRLYRPAQANTDYTLWEDLDRARWSQPG